MPRDSSFCPLHLFTQLWWVSTTPHPQSGCAFNERYLSFHHLTSCACSSWLTQTRFSSTPASPPNTIGFTYHFTFPVKRPSGCKVVSPSGTENDERYCVSRGTVGTE